MLDGTHPRFPEELALVGSINAHTKALHKMSTVHAVEMRSIAKRLVQLLDDMIKLDEETWRPSSTNSKTQPESPASLLSID